VLRIAPSSSIEGTGLTGAHYNVTSVVRLLRVVGSPTVNFDCYTAAKSPAVSLTFTKSLPTAPKTGTSGAARARKTGSRAEGPKPHGATREMARLRAGIQPLTIEKRATPRRTGPKG
jgi:hypothetical protein